MLIMFGVIIITYLFFQSERLTSVERKRRENQSDISTSDAAIVNETADKGDAKCKNVNRTIETYEAGNWQKVDENGMVYVYSAYISWSGDNEVFIIGVEKPGDATEQGEIIIGQKTEELVYYCVYWYMGHFTNSKAEAKKIVSPLMERKK